MDLSVCVTDDDYEAWRTVRLAVEPGERCHTVAEMRAQDSSDRLLMLASIDGTVVGSGIADRSDTSGGGFVAPRVIPEYRRRGVGSGLLRALADHCTALGFPELRASVGDEESLAFATAFGFAEVDREVEQLRAVGDEDPLRPLPAGVDVVLLSEHPELWAACYDGFGTQVLADFALHAPLEISAHEWATTWRGDPMFLALHEGEVIGCAGLNLDADQPDRAENALTAVRRDWRGRGVALHLKQRTLQWAAANGVREIYTWTQTGNAAMRSLNERLGYVAGRTGVTLSCPLPLVP